MTRSLGRSINCPGEHDGQINPQMKQKHPVCRPPPDTPRRSPKDEDGDLGSIVGDFNGTFEMALKRRSATSAQRESSDQEYLQSGPP